MTIRNCSIALIQSIVITEENSKLLYNYIEITLIFIVEEFDCMLSYIVESKLYTIIIVLYMYMLYMGLSLLLNIFFFLKH